MVKCFRKVMNVDNANPYYGSWWYSWEEVQYTGVEVKVSWFKTLCECYVKGEKVWIDKSDLRFAKPNGVSA